NAPGPFYVSDGCCISCDLPLREAPGLFAYDGKNHCYVSRQPAGKNDPDTMVYVAWAAETQCIRYRGQDSGILRRFAEHLGETVPAAARRRKSTSERRVAHVPENRFQSK